LNDADNVHKINQLKEIRLSLNKLRGQSKTAANQSRQNSTEIRQWVKSTAAPPPRLSLEPACSESYIGFVNMR